MLHIIGTQKDLQNFEGLVSNEVYQRVTTISIILDENYGSDRNIYEDDGGYICIVENDNDTEELKVLHGLDLSSMTPEYCTSLSDKWVELLVLCNNEFGISIFLSKETFAYSEILLELNC